MTGVIVAGEDARTGWCITRVTRADIDTAQRERAERDARGLGGHYSGDDHRWHGELGEIVFARWLTACGVPYTHNGGVDNLPDFHIATVTTALKTTTHKNPHGRTWAPVPVRHINRPVDYYAFGCYMERHQRFAVMGAIDTDVFRAIATPIDPDLFPHPAVRVNVRDLMLPRVFLATITARQRRDAA